MGCAINALFTDACKMLVGRLRPNFYATCIPVPADKTLCAKVSVLMRLFEIVSLLAQDPTAYVEDYTCSGTHARLVRESRMSFPSGHSSFVFYTATFAVVGELDRKEVNELYSLQLYVQARAHWRPFGSMLLRPVVQAVFISPRPTL